MLLPTSGFFRANLLQALKHAYAGRKKRSVDAHPLRLRSKPRVVGSVYLPNTQSTLEAFPALSSKGLRKF
jgi:hypothetical protein